MLKRESISEKIIIENLCHSCNKSNFASAIFKRGNIKCSRELKFPCITIKKEII